MQIIGGILGLALTVLQFAAIIAGFHDWLGLHIILAIIAALFLAPLPLVGTIVGILGAVHSWGWPWWQAILLFFGMMLVVIVSGGASALKEKLFPSRF